MLEWPPRDPPPPTLPSTPLPPLAALRALFHHAYATLPAYIWDLPLPQQSDEVLRHVSRTARCYTPEGLAQLNTRHGVHPGEFAIVSALANLNGDIERFLAELYRTNPDDDFPAAMLDPEGRRGRRLS
jgi:hypothetical protein